MRAVVQGTAAAFGARAEITFQEIAAPTINTPIEAIALADAAASLVGEAAVERNRTPVMGSEDFAYMLLQRPGAYIHVGNGTGDAGGCDVHNPHYDFNDAAIPYGGGVMAALVEQKLPRVK
jgi:hippurate hydrolase